jgi:hypothetical protein
VPARQLVDDALGWEEQRLLQQTGMQQTLASIATAAFPDRCIWSPQVLTGRRGGRPPIPHDRDTIRCDTILARDTPTHVAVRFENMQQANQLRLAAVPADHQRRKQSA